MKWFAGTLGGFFLGLIGLCVFILIYTGYFKPVEILIATAQPLGPYKTLYVEVVGPYHEIGKPLSVVENFAKDQGLPCPRTFGRYLDDPKNIDHDRLRSEVGCLFDAATDLKPLTDTKAFKDLNYKTSNLNIESYIMGIFKGSPALVAFKVYPKILSEAGDKRLKLAEQAVEIYEVHGDKDVTTKVVFEVLP